MITLVEHPLAQHELSVLRDKQTDSAAFRLALKRISFFMAHEAYKNIEVESAEVETPFERTTGVKAVSNIIIVPVLRAGLSMLEPFQELLPQAKTGFIGIWRNEYTRSIEEYHYSMPPIRQVDKVILLDPVIASGQTACAALSRLQMEGVSSITFVTLVAAPDGIELIHTNFPDTVIIAAAIDRALNGKGYIVPGLGDAGDRMTGAGIV